MTTTLNYEGYEKYCAEINNGCCTNDGIQYVFRFDNNYGASVVKHGISYGHEEDLWELAVLRLCTDGKYHLCYDTEITDDVIGHLTDEEVRTYLGKIKEL
jgi:hypothetical protein